LLIHSERVNPPVNRVPMGNRRVYWKVTNPRMSRKDELIKHRS
jgi:hypothetical protein